MRHMSSNYLIESEQVFSIFWTGPKPLNPGISDEGKEKMNTGPSQKKTPTQRVGVDCLGNVGFITRLSQIFLKYPHFRYRKVLMDIFDREFVMFARFNTIGSDWIFMSFGIESCDLEVQTV